MNLFPTDYYKQISSKPKTEAQLIREQASKIDAETLKQIRINALDEMFELKRKQLNLEEMNTYEKIKTYMKSYAYEIYIRTYGYFFKHEEYLEHIYKWQLYWELKNAKAVIPKPNNFISSQYKQNIVRHDEYEEEEKKYPNE